MILKILLLGPTSGTCLDRANALRRLGHSVDHVDLRPLLPRTIWVDRVTWRLGGDWFTLLVLRGLSRKISGKTYDLCHVECGEWVTPRVIRLLREHSEIIVNYSIDDPLGNRDGARFRAYRQSVPHYDLCVVMRAQNVAESRDRGARHVLRVFMSADEVSHAPRVLTTHERRLWAADVLFIGTWFPERGAFMLRMIESGIPITIQGSNWQKAPEWRRLRAHWRGSALYGDDYAKAIQCAKVNIGLVSKGNRDLHTTRSIEIPALGALLCAERTPEHLALYEEGKEALFWKDPDECAVMCRFALDNESRRQSIATAGHVRAAVNGHYNEVVLRRVISLALETSRRTNLPSY